MRGDQSGEAQLHAKAARWELLASLWQVGTLYLHVDEQAQFTMEFEGIAGSNGAWQGSDAESVIDQLATERQGPQHTPARTLEPHRVLTCVYCGQAYPLGTPTHGSQVLTEHIRRCSHHPLRKAEADITTLRSAIKGVLGISDEASLPALELAIRDTPAPAQDKAVSIDAIHALLATSSTRSDRSALAIEQHALSSLVEVARAAHHAMDDSEELQDGRHAIDAQDAVTLCSALETLESLPDDQPGYTMSGPMRAAWALRRLIQR